MNKDELYNQVKAYANGKQAIEKYKKLCLSDKNKDWVSIDWNCGSRISAITKKLMLRFRQVIKNYQMVNRLKQIKPE